MNKISPIKVALKIRDYSSCRIKMSAVLVDRHGIFAWGWNHVGSGTGTHAEEYAINRSNRKRVKGCVIYVAGRHGNKNVLSVPCRDRCLPMLRRLGVKLIVFLRKDGSWGKLWV